MVLISVVMPSYNHESYISEAIESVLNQNFKDIELIIIDDYSTDKSREIIKKYKKIDERIKVIFHDQNEGISKTVNDGIEMGNGKYIAIICSDDIWDKSKLEKQYKILEKDENLIVWTEGELVDSQSRSLGITFTQNYSATKLRKKSGNIFKELLIRNFVLMSSLIFNKENLGEIRYNKRLKYLNDYQFFVDLAKNYKFYFINEQLTKYRLHAANTIYSDVIGLDKDALRVYTYLLKKYSNEIPKNIKWFTYLKIIDLFFSLGKKRKLRPYIYNTIQIRPLNLLGWLYLTKFYIKKDIFKDNIFRLGYKLYYKLIFLIKRFLKRYRLRKLINEFHDYRIFLELISRI